MMPEGQLRLNSCRFTMASDLLKELLFEQTLVQQVRGMTQLKGECGKSFIAGDKSLIELTLVSTAWQSRWALAGSTHFISSVRFDPSLYFSRQVSFDQHHMDPEPDDVRDDHTLFCVKVSVLLSVYNFTCCRVNNNSNIEDT